MPVINENASQLIRFINSITTSWFLSQQVDEKETKYTIQKVYLICCQLLFVCDTSLLHTRVGVSEMLPADQILRIICWLSPCEVFNLSIKHKKKASALKYGCNCELCGLHQRSNLLYKFVKKTIVGFEQTYPIEFTILMIKTLLPANSLSCEIN